jgi:3'-5' exoribonuclease
MAAAASANADVPTIATLRDADEVDGVFACTRKERRVSRVGAPYLSLELGDSTGTVIGRAFRDADLLAGRFDRGELVRVTGRAVRYREELQIEVHTIARALAEEADPASFLPTAYRDLDELEGFFEQISSEVYERPLALLLERLLGDRELRTELRRAPCSLPGVRAQGAHHAYLGGLLEHTVAVATMGVELCALHPRLDRDLLLTAALVHDLGKTREFAYGAEITRTQEGGLLGHIELGLRVLSEHAPSQLAGARRLHLEHCVMLHHGAEAASGARFSSHEALALYRLNGLDASLKSAFEHPVAASRE